jgi:dTDP-4-amino-4,6-dideoxygalactose transaminase
VSVPFLDLARLHASIAGELRDAFERTLAASAFSGGPELETFEADFAAAHHAPGAAGTASGTDALALALRALGMGPGDEVIVPSMTFIATAAAVVHAGATPVLADVDPDTLLLTPQAVEAVRTPRTCAVVPVHLYGSVVPFDHLRTWQQQGLLVVEDAAQAHLATDPGINGEPAFVGAASDLACFSFYAGKNLGALGDGGLVTSSNSLLLDLIRSLRDHGRSDKYTHERVGWCSRLDSMQAAFLGAKLRHLPAWTASRRRLADHYAERLSELPAERIALVPWRPGAVHHLLVVRVPASQRGDLMDTLSAAGIGVGIHYPLALSQQPALRQWARPTPQAEQASAEIVSLPMDPLMSIAEVDQVCDAIQAWVGSRLVMAGG